MCILWPDFLNHLVMDSVYFQDKFHSKVSDYESSFVMKIFNYFSFLFFLIYHCEDVSLPAFYIFPWLIEVMKTIWSFFFTQFCILNNWFSCIYNIFSDAQNPHITSFDACKYSGITFFLGSYNTKGQQWSWISESLFAAQFDLNSPFKYLLPIAKYVITS